MSEPSIDKTQAAAKGITMAQDFLSGKLMDFLRSILPIPSFSGISSMISGFMDLLKQLGVNAPEVERYATTATQTLNGIDQQVSGALEQGRSSVAQVIADAGADIAKRNGIHVDQAALAAARGATAAGTQPAGTGQPAALAMAKPVNPAQRAGG